MKSMIAFFAKYRCQFLLIFILFGVGINASERYCGRGLDEALLEICKGGVRSVMDKKSVRNADAFYFPPYFINPTFPAHRSLLRHRRSLLGRIGAYDECCKKPCTYSELRGYCRSI